MNLTPCASTISANPAFSDRKPYPGWRASAPVMSAADSIAAIFKYESRAGAGPMHTLSSARRTCMASASAVECTATVGMPSSLQARRMRSAISPRLAIRIFSNMARAPRAARSLDDHQRFAEFHRLGVLEQNLHHRARPRSGNLVHRLHRLDDEERVARLDDAADLAERLGAGFRRAI